MYIKLTSETGKRFTFFKKERVVNNERVTHTDKSVFGTLSEGIKVGEKNGQILWENDYWNTVFCGKAYQKALELEDKTRIIVTEMNVRNVYSRNTKRNYPQIMVTEFEIAESAGNENPASGNTDDDSFMNIPEGLDEELPFKD